MHDAARAHLERLELFRRSVDLRIDAEGRWWHEGEPFVHQGLIGLFNRGLDQHPDTHEPILRIDGKWCYVRADDTPFVVRRLLPQGAVLTAVLNTEAQVPVPAAGFELRGAHVYVPLGLHRRARLDRVAQARLAEWLEADGDGWVVVVGAHRWPVRVV